MFQNAFYTRQRRIANLIKKTLSILMVKYGIFLNITKVLINKDFQIAEVFFNLRCSSKKEKYILSLLQMKSKYFRKLLSKCTYLKIIPKIMFKSDIIVYKS